MDSHQNKYLCTRYNATWQFQGKPSSDHAALNATIYSAQELSYINLLPTIHSHIWFCSMEFMGFLHFCI